MCNLLVGLQPSSSHTRSSCMCSAAPKLLFARCSVGHCTKGQQRGVCRASHRFACAGERAHSCCHACLEMHGVVACTLSLHCVAPPADQRVTCQAQTVQFSFVAEAQLLRLANRQLCCGYAQEMFALACFTMFGALCAKCIKCPMLAMSPCARRNASPAPSLGRERSLGFWPWHPDGNGAGAARCYRSDVCCSSLCGLPSCLATV